MARCPPGPQLTPDSDIEHWPPRAHLDNRPSFQSRLSRTEPREDWRLAAGCRRPPLRPAAACGGEGRREGLRLLVCTGLQRQLAAGGGRPQAAAPPTTTQSGPPCQWSRSTNWPSKRPRSCSRPAAAAGCGLLSAAAAGRPPHYVAHCLLVSLVVSCGRPVAARGTGRWWHCDSDRISSHVPSAWLARGRTADAVAQWPILHRRSTTPQASKMMPDSSPVRSGRLWSALVRSPAAWRSRVQPLQPDHEDSITRAVTSSRAEAST